MQADIVKTQLTQRLGMLIKTAVIVDLNKVKDREDLCTDAWRWKLWDTYPTSSPPFEGPYRKGNNPSEYHTVRRTYKCLTHEQIEKQIYLTYPPAVVASH